MDARRACELQWKLVLKGSYIEGEAPKPAESLFILSWLYGAIGFGMSPDAAAAEAATYPAEHHTKQEIGALLNSEVALIKGAQS